jgi:hypothetical protein
MFSPGPGLISATPLSPKEGSFVPSETLRQFEALKAEDAARETQVTKRADKSAETIASDNYLHNREICRFHLRSV